VSNIVHSRLCCKRQEYFLDVKECQKGSSYERLEVFLVGNVGLSDEFGCVYGSCNSCGINEKYMVLECTIPCTHWCETNANALDDQETFVSDNCSSLYMLCHPISSSSPYMSILWRLSKLLSMVGPLEINQIVT